MKAFLDIETGGFSVSKNGVCEIAMLAVSPEGEVVDSFHKLIKPYPREEGSPDLVSYKPDSMAINGLTEDILIDNGIDVREVIEDFWIFLVDNKIRTIVAHGAKSFDMPRINHLLNRFAKRNIDILNIDIVCTIQIAREKLPQLAGHKLEHLCAHFEIVNSRSHSALGDTAALLDVYKCLDKI